MDPDKPPKRPVVTSLAGALSEIARWQAQNQLNEVRDGDGQVWDLAVRATQIPDPADPRRVLWQVTFALTASVSVRELLAAKVLDPARDARLLELIGSHSIDLAMKPSVHVAASEDAARALVAEMLPDLKASFAKSSLVEVKRALAGRWVDDRSRFGGWKTS